MPPNQSDAVITVQPISNTDGLAVTEQPTTDSIRAEDINITLNPTSVFLDENGAINQANTEEEEEKKKIQREECCDWCNCCLDVADEGDPWCWYWCFKSLNDCCSSIGNCCMSMCDGYGECCNSCCECSGDGCGECSCDGCCDGCGDCDCDCSD